MSSCIIHCGTTDRMEAAYAAVRRKYPAQSISQGTAGNGSPALYLPTPTSLTVMSFIDGVLEGLHRAACLIETAPGRAEQEHLDAERFDGLS